MSNLPLGRGLRTYRHVDIGPGGAGHVPIFSALGASHFCFIFLLGLSTTSQDLLAHIVRCSADYLSPIAWLADWLRNEKSSLHPPEEGDFKVFFFSLRVAEKQLTGCPRSARDEVYVSIAANSRE